MWSPVDQVGKLGFDHNQILDDALIALRNKMKHDRRIFSKALHNSKGL